MTKRRRQRLPPLPIRAVKAHLKLSQAIICSDHELASHIDLTVKTNQVTGQPRQISHLRRRLNLMMEPLAAYDTKKIEDQESLP